MVFSTTDDCGPFLRFGRIGNWGLLYLLLGQVVACQANHSHPYFIRKAIEGAVGLLPGSTWLGWWGMCIRCCPRCYEMKESQWWHVMAPQRLVRPNPLWSNISRGLLRRACFLLAISDPCRHQHAQKRTHRPDCWGHGAVSQKVDQPANWSHQIGGLFFREFCQNGFQIGDWLSFDFTQIWYIYIYINLQYI